MFLTRSLWLCSKRLGVAALVISLLSESAFGGDTNETDHPWTISTTNEVVRFSTNGHVVDGHQFGFVKRKRACDDDILWMTWSTMDGNVKSLQGTDAQLRLTVGNVRVPLNVELLATYQPFNLTTLLAFTNFLAGPKLVELLGSGQQAEVEVIGPQELVSHLDIRQDTFSLVGYSQSRAEAQRSCQVGQ